MSFINNHSRLDNIIETLHKTLNLDTLARINPIFRDDPFIDIDGNKLVIHYPETYEELISTSGDRPIPYHWFLIDNIAVRFENVAYWEGNTMPSPLTIFHLQDAPTYLYSINKAINKHLKNILIFVDDRLPSYLEISIEFDFNLKKTRKSILRNVADWLIRDSGSKIKNKITKLISDDSVSFRESLDEIIKLSEVRSDKKFSYCLSCGDLVDKDKLFCDAKKRRYRNRDNCRNKFRYWIQSRLGINDVTKHQQLRKELYSELKKLISLYPFSAFEHLRNKYPRIYTSKHNTR